jgi:outer membrane protein assembly factor BamB
MNRILPLLAVLIFTSAARADDFAAQRDRNWHQWRGPHANGVAPQANPPAEWDEQTNIKWKVPIPGLGNATPIVWEDQIFVLTAVESAAAEDKTAQTSTTAQPQQRRRRGGSRRPTQTAFLVLCLDRATGAVRWQQTAANLLPHEGFRPGDNTFASGSPITDGRHLFVSFGSYGIFCYDLDGNQVWKQDLGDMHTRNGFGEGSSPALYRDRLVVNWDHEGQSFIATLDARTGDVLWKKDRDEPTSWATPLVVEHGGRTQVVTNGSKRVRSYDLATGELIWECGGQVSNVIPSPVIGDGVVYCTSGFRGAALYAIPIGSTGDLTGTDKPLWNLDRGTPYVPSPLLYGDLLYFNHKNDPIATCVNAKTGEVLATKRLAGLDKIYASPVGAAGRVYYVGRNGTTVVLPRGNDLGELAVNKLDEGIDASPAIVGNELFLRGKQHLYCIAAD